MTVSLDTSSVTPIAPATGTSAAPAGRRWPVLETALVVEGVALTALVAFSGSAAWGAIRVGVVTVLTALTLRVARPGGPRARGLVAVVAGLVGLVAGLGIGVSFTARSGLSVRGLAGLVCLAAGLVLLTTGTVALVRASHGWRRGLGVPIAFVVLQFVAMPLFGAVVITNVPPDTIEAATPADHGVPYEDVTFLTSDGVALSAWYVPSSNRAALVLLAGSGSTRSGALDQAIVLARHGYGALVMDNRGHGRSEGIAMDTGWFGDLDIAAAVTFLQTRNDVDPTKIAVVGMSMGGEEALGAAATDHRIRAVVAEGATGRDSADLVDLPGTVTGVIERVTSWTQFRLADLLTDAPTPTPLVDAAARTAPRPVLLIAATGETTANRRFQDAAPTSIELWEPPDTAHVAALRTHPAEWEERVTTFLDRALDMDRALREGRS